MVTRVTLTPADLNDAMRTAREAKEAQPKNAWMAETRASTPFNGSVQNGELASQRASVRHADHVGSVETVDDSVIKIGDMTMTREVALSQGIVREVDGQLVATDEAASVVKASAAKEAATKHAADTDMAIYEAHNAALDTLEAEYGPAILSEATEEIITSGDVDLLEDVPQEIIRGYTHVAQGLAKDVGLDNLDLMGLSLDDNQQERARRALLTGDQTTFKQLARTAIHQAGQLSLDADFVADLEDAGCRVIGRGTQAQIVFDDGSMMSFVEALRSGVVRLD